MNDASLVQSSTHHIFFNVINLECFEIREQCCYFIIIKHIAYKKPQQFEEYNWKNSQWYGWLYKKNICIVGKCEA